MLRNSSIYQVFVRNYKGEGKFKDLINDIKRISDMGFEYLYLCPIHPIGKVNRKGTLGSPYAISDYYKINDEYGDMEDFDDLVKECHNNNLKIMIDIVINHSSPDCVFTLTNPEFYYRNNEGNFGNRVADWTDVIDFNYDNKALREEMIKMLSFWANKGVDGFRCDVASLVPSDFWLEAKEAISKINKDFVWLGESVEFEFIEAIRKLSFKAFTDYELFEAFDMLYSYDIKSFINDAFINEKNLNILARMINYQNSEFKLNNLKVKYLENHDNERIYTLLKKNKNKVLNYLAFIFLQRGVPFVYAGQEAWCEHKPTLFDKDMLDWSNYDETYVELIKKLNSLRKLDIFKDETYCHVGEHEDYFDVTLCSEKEEYYGIYNVLDLKDKMKTELNDGTYINLIDDKEVIITNTEVDSSCLPLFVRVK